jgi:activator of 2-hydroxyglutaryl-CoA dehydratase
MLFIGGIAAEGYGQGLEDRLGIKVTVPYECEYVCAIGAALLGLKTSGSPRRP